LLFTRLNGFELFTFDCEEGVHFRHHVDDQLNREWFVLFVCGGWELFVRRELQIEESEFAVDEYSVLEVDVALLLSHQLAHHRE
jgi:hypothetical protein